MELLKLWISLAIVREVSDLQRLKEVIVMGDNMIRELKVGGAWNLRKRGIDEEVPMLRLRGQWLRRAGFEKGDQLVIEAGQGKLIINRFDL